MKRERKNVAIGPLIIALLLCLVFPALVWADPAKEKVTICHMPGTPAQKTMQVPANAVSQHLAHGDALGSCSDLPPGSVPAQPGKPVEAVTICHKPGTPAQKTMDVTLAALDAHLGHGDLLGPCEDLLPPSAVEPGETGRKVLICHKPGTPAQKTMNVPVDALEAHLDHGDVLGSCQDLVGTTGCRRPLIAASGAAMTTWRGQGWQRPYAY